MIVPAMTIQEIYKELFEDVKNIETKLEYCRKEFRREVLQTNKYPMDRYYECKTPKKKNLFIATFTAIKRGDNNNPIIGIYGIYSRPEGKYAATLNREKNLMSIYPPHFFNRYKERIFNNISMSAEDIIKHYFKNNWGFLAAIVNTDITAVYKCFENDGSIDIVATTDEGYCFGERQGNITIVKTIISDNMLFENQKPLFNELREKYSNFMKNKFGIK